MQISAHVQRRMARWSSVGESGTSYLATTIEIVTDEDLLGRGVVALQAIIDVNEMVETLVGDDDTLFVPKHSNTISVVGEVYEPEAYSLQKCGSLYECIDAR